MKGFDPFQMLTMYFMSVYGGLNELDFGALELGGNLLKQFPLDIFLQRLPPTSPWFL